MKRSFLTRASDYLRLRTSLKDLASDSPLSLKKVSAVLDGYRQAFTQASVISENLVNGLNYDSYTKNQLKTIAKVTHHYLAERITVTPFHVINVLTRDPFYAHSDIAALNRGLFESAVNLLYLLQEDSEERIERFYVSSIQHELKLQKSMEQWVGNRDTYIACSAKKQSLIEDRTSDELLADVLKSLGREAPPSPYPKLRDRCASLPKIWEFYYDSKYRGLSAWQHGDVSRIFVSSTMKQLDPTQRDRPVFEGMGMCAWSWDLVHWYLRSLIDLTDNREWLKRLEVMNKDSYQIMTNSLRDAMVQFQGEAFWDEFPYPDRADIVG